MRQLQNAHDPDDTQKAQIQSGHQGLQKEGQDRQQVDQAVKAQHIAQAAAIRAGLCGSFHFCSRPDPQQVFHTEKQNRKRVKQCQSLAVLLLDRRHRFQNHGHDVEQDHQGQHP